MLNAPLLLLLTIATGKEAPTATRALLFLFGLGSRKSLGDVELAVLALALATGQTEPAGWPAAASSSTPRSASSPGLPSGSPDWTPDEMAQFARELAPVGVPLDQLLLVLAAESGLDPHAARSSAWGLNQAQQALLSDAGWKGTGPAYATLGVSSQIPWLGRMLPVQFRWIGYKPQTAIELFRMNLSPMAAKARSEVIYDSGKLSEAGMYAGNKALDVTNDGRIDMTDLGARLIEVSRTPRYQRHLAMLKALP